MLLNAEFTLNSVFPEQSIGFPIQALLGLICFVLPLLGFFIQACWGNRLWRKGDWLPTGAMFLSFLCAVGIAFIHLSKYDPNYAVEWRMQWISIKGDGAGVEHTPANFAKLHLGQALHRGGYIDNHGRPTANLTFGEPKAPEAFGKPVSIADNSYLAELVMWMEAPGADDVERLKAFEREPEHYWSQRVLKALDAKDGAKEARNHQQFNRWLAGGTQDAQFARQALSELRADPKLNAGKVNSENWLANAFAVGVYIDNFTCITLLMVTLLSFLIHLFSTGYMKGEVRYARFFATINLFTAGMIGLVLTNSFVWLFVCWEIMGLCSYLLIGHYFEKPSAQAANMKAFITTRIGDVFMFIGMMLIFYHTKSLLFSGPNEFQAMFKGWTEGAFNGTFTWGLTTYGGPGSLFAGLSGQLVFVGGAALSVIGVLLFIGPVGKSAQFPLHVWLPDAMEGPTPVSAMIHAACMVSAGVYLTARLFPVFSPDALLVIAYTGGFTALFAGTIGLMQTDIKKVLAYSTISQLGYMFLGIGCGAWVPAVFHMITHAFFKALMFLGSGSVILGCSHEQEMTRMGGLFRKMPVTATTFWIGNLAITGFPFVFSGFYSKEAVLTQAHIFGMESAHLMPYIFGALGAGLTTFYMFRLVWLTFHGKPKDQWVHDHAKESPWNVVYPLIIIALFAVVIGWPVFAASNFAENLGVTNQFWIAAVVFIALAIVLFLWFHRTIDKQTGHQRHHEAEQRGVVDWIIWLCSGFWLTPRGLGVLALIIVLAFAFSVQAPQVKHESERLYRDMSTMEGLVAVRQLEHADEDARQAARREREIIADAEQRLEQALREARFKRAQETGREPTPGELDALRAEIAPAFNSRRAQALAELERELNERVKHGHGGVTGRPEIEDRSWFFYLVNKPRTIFSEKFLLDEARLREEQFDKLYIGHDGHPLLADSPGMAPSPVWGGRLNAWLAANGLPIKPEYPESPLAAGRQLLAEQELHEALSKAMTQGREVAPALVSAAPWALAPAAAPADKGHGDHGAHDDGHGAHGHGPHDPVIHAWHEVHHSAHLMVFGGSMIAFLIGLALSMFFFSPWGPFHMREWVGHVGFLYSARLAMKRGYYMDEFYYGSIIRAQFWLMHACAWFDKVIVDGCVNLVGRVSVWMGFAVAKIDYWGVDGTVRGVSNLTGYAGAGVSKAPTGKISDYVFMLIAVIVLLFMLLATLA